MKKKYAKTKLIIVTILVIIALCLTVFAFDIPGGSNKFLGFIGAIKTSNELDSSYKVEFTVDRNGGEVTNSDINEGVEKMYDIFTNFMLSYNDTSVTRQTKNGEEMLVAYVPATELGSSFFTLFEDSKKLEVKKGDDVILTNDDIKTATYTMNGSSYVIYLEFESAGTRKLMQYDELELSYYIGESSVTGTIYNNSYVLLSSSDFSSNANTASSYAIELLAGKIPFTMTVSLNTTVDANVGSNVKLILKITTGVIALLYVCYMIVKHKFMGLVSLLSAGIFVSVDAFVLQSIPVMSLTLASYFAIIVSFVIYALSVEYQFTKMEKQFSIGKRVPVAVKQGYKGSLLTLMDIHLTAFITALAMIVLASRQLKAVAIAFICGLAISALLSMLINHYFVKLLVDIYPQDSKKFNFKREDTVDEI